MKYCYEIGTQIPVFSNFVSKGRLLIHCEFEWLKKSILSSRKPTIMFSVQHELFNVNIDVSTVKFERTFVNAAKSLPTYETDPDENTIKAYKSFFDKYGTHCILRLSYGGHINGSIEFPFTTEISSDMMNAQAKKVEHLLWIFFETCQNYNNSISDYKSILDPNSHELFAKIMKSSIKCVGGNKIFSNSKMEDINPTRWSEWVNSLNINFVFLEDILYAGDIFKLLKKVDINLSVSMKKCIKQNFQSENQTEDQFTPVYECPEPQVWSPTTSMDSDAFNLLTRDAASASVKSDLRCQII